MNSATNYVCEEIVIEILRRLPVKSLVRFTAVCRRWKSIITGPQFTLQPRPSKLLVHTDQECYALVQGDEDEFFMLSETVEFPTKRRLRTASVVGSGNGLVCMCVTRKITSFTRIIWNPSIRRHAVIPPNKDVDVGYFVSQGFGATISGDDYKYVKFLAFYDRDEDEYLAVDIYSWKTGTWRRNFLDYDLYKRMCFSSEGAASPMVSLRGRLHWAASNSSKNIYSVSVFDLEDEVFGQEIMFPECFSSHMYFLGRVNLFVTKESELAMIVNEDEPNRVMHYCSVWVMQEYGDVNSWTKLFRLDLAAIVDVVWALQDQPFVKEYGIRRVPNGMVHLLKNGELLLGLEVGVGVAKFPTKLVKYNPKTSKATDIHGVSSSSELCGFTNYYKESLAFLAEHDDHRRVRADHEVLAVRFRPSKKRRRKLKHQF